MMPPAQDGSSLILDILIEVICRCGDDTVSSTVLLLLFFPTKSYITKIYIQLENLLDVTSVMFLCPQSMMNVSAGSTTVMRMPCASTWLEATAAPVNRATLAMGQSAKVSALMLIMLFVVQCLYKCQNKTPQNVVAVVGHDCKLL